MRKIWEDDFQAWDHAHGLKISPQDSLWLVIREQLKKWKMSSINSAEVGSETFYQWLSRQPMDPSIVISLYVEGKQVFLGKLLQHRTPQQSQICENIRNIYIRNTRKKQSVKSNIRKI